MEPAPTLLQRIQVLFLGDVQVVHVGRVVLAVVKLHDLGVDMRLQGAIVVRQVGEFVLLPGAHRPQSGHQPPARAGKTNTDRSAHAASPLHALPSAQTRLRDERRTWAFAWFAGCLARHLLRSHLL